MASKIPNSFLKNISNGTIDLDTNTIKARLVMTNTTCDTEIDAIANLTSYTTIDVSDASGYADVSLTTPTITEDDSGDKAYFNAVADIVFAALGGNATRDYQGVLIYKYVAGGDANCLPICFINFTSNILKTATQVTVPVSTTNILNITQG